MPQIRKRMIIKHYLISKFNIIYVIGSKLYECIAPRGRGESDGPIRSYSKNPYPPFPIRKLFQECYTLFLCKMTKSVETGAVLVNV